jgi:hypothetical protein
MNLWAQLAFSGISGAGTGFGTAKKTGFCLLYR